jgi:hypothetical protein
MAFEIKSTTERLESVAGLALVGEIARMAGLDRLEETSRSLNNALVGMFGLLALGRSSFEEIDLYRSSDLFAAIARAFIRTRARNAPPVLGKACR